MIEENFDKEALELVMQTGGEVFSPVFVGNTMYQTLETLEVLDNVYTELDYTKLFKLLREAVSLQLPDEDIAVMLSGGVDSTLLLKMITEEIDRDVVAYHLNWHYEPRDESKWAKLAADFCGVEYREIDVSPKISVNYLQECLTKTKTIDYSITPCYMAMKQMKSDGFNDVVNALGLDEYFAGYPIHRRLYERMDSRWPHIFPYYHSNNRYIRYILRKIKNKIGDDKSFFMDNAFSRKKNFVQDVDFNMISSEVYNFVKGNDAWDTIRAWNVLLMVNNYATAIQRAALNTGMRVTFPYIDRNLMNYGMNLFPELKRNKIPIRNLMADAYEFPQSLVNRGGDWSDTKKWDKFALGGTVAPYIDSCEYMECISPDIQLAKDWFSKEIIDDYLRRPIEYWGWVSVQMSMFLKMLEWI